jgi:environmental stress-induced protein Ves
VSIVRGADIAVTPWKNGMGRTRELAIHPAGAALGDFDWRVSVAEVDSAAPFSAFPGVDRQIALLEGAGFVMRFADGGEHRLDEPCVPFAFAGEASVDVTLIDGVALVYATRADIVTPEGRLHAGDVWHVPDGMQDALTLDGESVALAVRLRQRAV